MVKTGLVETIDSLVPLDKRLATFLGTDNQEKDEKRSQNDKTGLGMEKQNGRQFKVKPKPESQPKSTPTNPKVNM
ncbi:hypothetical protein Tco_0510919 [Tanacetum coccineum]